MTFLRDHMEIDVGHNRLMQKYAEALIKTEADIEAVHYAMKTTGYLYAQMIDAAFDDVDKAGGYRLELGRAERGWINAQNNIEQRQRRGLQLKAAGYCQLTA